MGKGECVCWLCVSLPTIEHIGINRQHVPVDDTAVQ